METFLNDIFVQSDLSVLILSSWKDVLNFFVGTVSAYDLYFKLILKDAALLNLRKNNSKLGKTPMEHLFITLFYLVKL